MHFLLDEDLSRTIAAIGRSMGLDIVSVQELSDRRGRTDVEQLRYAAVQGRCLVTVNCKDFKPLALRFAEQGLPHAGVLCVPPSWRPNAYREIAEAIATADRDYPEGVPAYFVGYLRRSPG